MPPLNIHANFGFDTFYRFSLNLQKWKIHIVGQKENMIWNTYITTKRTLWLLWYRFQIFAGSNPVRLNFKIHFLVFQFILRETFSFLH